MGGFLWFIAGATVATIYCNGRIQAGYYSANPNGYYERGWVHQSAPINESDERVPESEGRERRYAYGAGMRLEGQQKFGLEVPQQQRERLEAPPPAPPQPPRQEEQPSLERIRELSKQADEAMSDLSEATLDSLMATIIAAKNKLAERRTQREQEEKRASEANKFPPRYV
ncbi:uncharacterized protein ARMOST_12435 [Armillaria ostoyae]|uniref:Uncharacterized protein n=1 Tax=Armillaria ostoyae TaxID=47428 RepID=A0A284RJX6_ARMOS|nr:hypothetical protein EDD85DRAFT_62464 [Armillaria nabsnona]SJL09059.1 uncharacterized protein ARMOST_12435 [Armillaria ostoyae]